MPRKLKKLFKYKCLELLCNTVHRQDKWLEHCRSKHTYKFKNNLNIKYSIVQVKEGQGPWTPYKPTSEQRLPEYEHEKDISLPSTSATVTSSASTSTNQTEAVIPLPGSDSDESVRKQKITNVSISPNQEIEFLNNSYRQQETQNIAQIKEDKSLTLSSEGILHSTRVQQPKTIEEHYCDLNEDDNDSSVPTKDPTYDGNQQMQIDEDVACTTEEYNQLMPSSDDPAYFANKKLSPEMINAALKLENQNLDTFNFPSTGGRKFNGKAKQVLLPNGTSTERKWLVYSKYKDAAFCLHCLLFALPKERSIWGTTGYRGWIDHRGDRDIDLHEKSKYHVSSQIARLQYFSQQRIDKTLAQQTDSLVAHHREVLSVIIDCCRYLSIEMLAFRKKESLDGKFHNLFKLVAKYSPDARVYLEKLDKAKEGKEKLASNVLSYRNMFDIIHTMSEMVVSKIVQHVKETKAYSVILDSTQDISKKECTTLLVRYVEIKDSQGCIKDDVKPEERLIKVFTSGETTGEHLSSELLNTMLSLGLDKNWLVGQSMDGAGNMRGRFSGVKTFVLKECPKAFYIWCCSHRFALVIEKSMDICPQIRDMFSILQELYVFMSGHKRHHLFTEKLHKGPPNIRKKRLKRVLTTRWSSRIDALATVISCYDVLSETLCEISKDEKSDNDTRTRANGLFKALSEFETVATMKIASTVFKVLAPVTICFQSKNIDYGIVPAILCDTKARLEALRSDESWKDKMLHHINSFMEDHNISQPLINRPRRKKRFIDELSVDEPITNPIAKIRVEVYFKLLDSLINQLEDRFPENTLHIAQQMTYFSHEGLLKIADNEDGTINPTQINGLCEFYNIDTDETCEEINVFSRLYKEGHRNINLFDIILEKSEECDPQNLHDDYSLNSAEVTETSKERLLDQWVKKGFIKPYRFLINMSGFRNLMMLYHIILSLPVTSCSAERTMSRLKIVKNRLRSSMGDVWLSNLLILASENDILKSISNSEIIDKFAQTTVPRRKLLLYKSHQA